MKRTHLTIIALLSLGALSACGTTSNDRALSGAAIGAGVGVVGGYILGAPVEGALIGGAVGAGTGVLTDPDRVNLGRPIWR
jgi:osmotically inducible lipoprotein OsmB